MSEAGGRAVLAVALLGGGRAGRARTRPQRDRGGDRTADRRRVRCCHRGGLNWHEQDELDSRVDARLPRWLVSAPISADPRRFRAAPTFGESPL